MRSKPKKLVLHRETLSDLDRAQLGQAAGGTSYQYNCPSFTCYPDNCQYSGYNTCFTCEMTCTTNYC
ncbi:MAG TPA: class I lanthipeptide [Thermoanaerobaculia bacterium]|jgi:hypothetical protein|nr:class I lanthipeptide [Thermoanaerobaculia bacterium]